MRIIRDYKSADWEQVCEIYDLSKPDEMKGLVDSNLIIPLAHDDKMLLYFNESTIWVYEDAYKIIGFIGIKEDVVSWLFVHPGFRRKGVARKLITRIIKEHNHSLKLNIAKTNHAAMSLYLDLGFEVFEEFEGKMYGQAIPAVRMKLNKSAEPVI